MLGSINTGGFNKSQVDAMRDSNYFIEKVLQEFMIQLIDLPQK